MDKKFDCVGKITSGEMINHFIKIEDDRSGNTGGICILTSKTPNRNDGWFDDWVESEAALDAFLQE